MSRNNPWAKVIDFEGHRRLAARRSTDAFVIWAVLGFLVGGVLVFAALNRDLVLQTASNWLDAYQELQVPHDADSHAGRIRICRDRTTPTCVIDGDTIRLHGERIRLLGIDAPELFDPACAFEREVALQARARLVEILSGEPWRMAPDGSDRFGRTLARLRVGDDWAGSILVEEGLAYWFEDRRSWC